MFSSPLWGFFYLICFTLCIWYGSNHVLVPSLGILLFNYLYQVKRITRKYVLVPSLGILLFNKNQINFTKMSKEVLVPSLGILLFNRFMQMIRPMHLVLVPSLGILLFNKLCRKLQLQKQRSRPLSGDSFI